LILRPFVFIFFDFRGFFVCGFFFLFFFFCFVLVVFFFSLFLGFFFFLFGGVVFFFVVFLGGVLCRVLGFFFLGGFVGWWGFDHAQETLSRGRKE